MASYADNSTMAIADNPLMVTAHKSAVANAVNAATAAATGAEGESSSVRKTQGRRRIEMKKIKKKTSLQVTFAKRRPGLVKKASELSTLCGAEVALLIFSPAGKPYIFGHPDFQKIIDRYLVNNPPSESLTEEDAEMHDVTNELICAELAEKLGNLRVQLAGENDQGAFLDGIWKSFHNSVNWWENPIEGLEINELQYMTQALIWIGERAQRIVRKYMDQGFSDPNFVPYPGDFSSHPAGHHNIVFDSGFGGGIPSVDHQALPNYVSNIAAPASNPTDGANGYGSAFGAGGTLSLLGLI